MTDIVGKLHYELLNSLELFIVGHEYGHIFAGHLDNAILVKSMFGDDEFSKIIPDWQMEYEADFYGVNLLVNLGESRNLLPFSILRHPILSQSSMRPILKNRIDLRF